MSKEYIRGIRDTLMTELVLLIYTNLLIKMLFISGVFVI